MRFEVEAGEFIRETFNVFERLRESRRFEPAASIPEEQQMKDFLDYHLNLSRLRRAQEQMLQKRVQTQIGVVRNYPTRS
jgi:hypothetical protein